MKEADITRDFETDAPGAFDLEEKIYAQILAYMATYLNSCKNNFT